jgi:UDP:flavonoid glycosyltransferase YjiC (YdhE family)
MRVLFTTWAWPTHLYALAPLAWACRVAGHEVLFASQPGLLDDVLLAGLPAAVVGKDVDTAGMVREYLLPTRPRAGGGGSGGSPRAVQMLLAHAESMVDDLIELARDWRADLVVYDPTALAGPLAASAAGVPAVRHLYGADLLSRVNTVLTEAFAPLAGRCGGGAFDPSGVATVDPVPASVQTIGEYRRLPMRYVPFNGPAAAPVGLASRDRPRVCVSWGHTIAKVEPERFLAVRAAIAAADLGADVVLAISAEQRVLLPPLPETVQILVGKPLQHILPECDLLVGHGGAGGILTALHHGVPLLLVPQLPDHAGHSARVAARGAGVVLPIHEAGDALLRDRIGHLLSPGAGEPVAARAVAAEMREQPSPVDVAAELASLVRVH